jgi:branched-chain amino acid transport system permease protein
MAGLKRYLPVLACALCAFLLPPLFAAANAAYLLTQLTMSAYYALASLGLCALMGYAGQISLGQAGFFAIGAYASAFISKSDPSISPWIACACAVLLAAMVAALIGTPVLRLKGHYLAMATLGFGIIIEKIARGTKGLGGADGLSGVSPFAILPGLVVTGGKAARAANFSIAWVVLALGLLALVNLVHSRAGRALRALRDGEEAAGAMGVDIAGYKLKVFVIGAVYAAVAGVLLTRYDGSIGPGEASFVKSVRYVAIVAVGGMDNLTGTLVAGIVLNFLSLRGIFGKYDDAVFGLILVAVMLFAPEGRALRRAARAALAAMAGRPRPAAGAPRDRGKGAAE